MVRSNKAMQIISIICIMSMLIPLFVGCHDSAHVHDFSDWFMVKEATCKQIGEESRVCLDCGETENRETGYGLHSSTGWITHTHETCTNDGKLIKKCAVCNMVLQTRIIEKTGHEFVLEWIEVESPTCNSEGKEQRKCLNCDAKEERPIPTSSHEAWEEWLTIEYPTCTEDGLQAKLCKHCNKIVEEEVLPAEHVYGSETNGQGKRKCIFCDHYED